MQARQRTQPLKQSAAQRAATSMRARVASLAGRAARWAGPLVWTFRFARRRPRTAVAGLALLVAAPFAYHAHRADRAILPSAFIGEWGDRLANAAGFKIETLSITGHQQLTEAEILDAAGITANTSLLLLDVAAARQRLEANPWIAHATVRKLYPDHLEIAIEERRAFALWQKDYKLSLIAADGTVLAPVDPRAVPPLPLVVGPAAAAKAHEFLSLLDRHPSLREELRAAILVADRRWNLKLKSGLDIRLPETGVEAALDRLMALDRDKKILTRDLTAIDLRLPDRVTVRLSEEAAQAREQALKDKKKRKGGDA